MKYLFGYICDGLVNEAMIFLYSRLLSCHCLVAKLCLTLCDPMDYSLPVCSVHTISLQECFAAAAAKSLQLCPTLCDPTDGSPPGSAVPGMLQATVLEWGAISFSNAWKWKVKVKSLSPVWLLVTPWTAAYQAPPSMGFSRQEYWSGVPLPSLMWDIIIFIYYITFNLENHFTF